MVNVTIYAIHGSYGFWILSFFLATCQVRVSRFWILSFPLVLGGLGGKLSGYVVNL